jgi:hypothetical protein
MKPRLAHLAVLVLGASALLAARPARAVSPLVQLTTSPDTTAVLQGQTVADENVLDEDLLGGAALQAIAGIPANADLVAYELLADGTELFSLDVTVLLPGNVVAEPRDVARFDPGAGTYALVFDGSAEGVPDGAQIDAIGSDGALLLLSFDTTIGLPAFAAADDDAVAFDGAAGTFTKVFDGAAAGVDGALDLDGLHHLSNGHLLVSFDTSGLAGGVPFDDEDVLEYTGPPPGTWEMAYDGTLADADWAAADLDAVSALEPVSDADDDGVADASDNCPRVSNPGQQDTGGIGAGSAPDGIGDVCQCGDATGDGRVTAADAVVITRAQLVPPTATIVRPELCDVGAGAPNAATLDCSLSDAVVIRRALLAPPTATIAQTCPAADGTP